MSRSRRSQRTQEERSTQTRRKLIEAAIGVAQESGYANLTITKVAQHAGLSNGAMQHHFTSRDDLVLGMLDALYPILDIPFDEIAGRKLSVKGRVNTFIDLLWQIYSRPEYLVIWDIAFGTRGDPQLKAKLQTYQREIRTRVCTQLAALFADLELTPEGADHVFLLVISCLRGFALQFVFGMERHRGELDQVKELACERILQYASVKARK